MRRQSLIALGAAIFLGLIAVFLVNAYLSGADKQVQSARIATTKVAVAQVALPFGTPITPEKVRFVDWPRSSVPPGAFHMIGELAPGGEPRVVLRAMDPGEPILRSKLSGEGGRASLSAVLPADKRAVAIPISSVNGVAGFVLPGDRVDVILTRTNEGSQVADVLLQDVRVIAIDQNASDKSDKPDLGKTATLEVDPYEAQQLALARATGTLSLALRAAASQPGDGYSERVSLADLGAGVGSGSFTRASAPSDYVPSYTPPLRRRAAVVPARPVAPRTAHVEIVRGVKGSNYEVGIYGGK